MSKVQLPTYSLDGVLKSWDRRHGNADDYNADLENAEKTCDAAIANYIKKLKQANPDITFIKP